MYRCTKCGSSLCANDCDYEKGLENVKTYMVEVTVELTYKYEIEAESPDEAIDIAEHREINGDHETLISCFRESEVVDP